MLQLIAVFLSRTLLLEPRYHFIVSCSQGELQRGCPTVTSATYKIQQGGKIVPIKREAPYFWKRSCRFLRTSKEIYPPSLNFFTKIINCREHRLPYYHPDLVHLCCNHQSSPTIIIFFLQVLRRVSCWRKFSLKRDLVRIIIQRTKHFHGLKIYEIPFYPCYRKLT